MLELSDTMFAYLTNVNINLLLLNWKQLELILINASVVIT